jgi:hypothetical protein
MNGFPESALGQSNVFYVPAKVFEVGTMKRYTARNRLRDLDFDPRVYPKDFCILKLKFDRLGMDENQEIYFPKDTIEKIEKDLSISGINNLEGKTIKAIVMYNRAVGIDIENKKE